MLRNLMCLVVILFWLCPVWALELYVSPAGSDKAAGTLDAPLQTLEGACAAVRKQKGQQGATVWLMPGRYVRTETFALDQRDSGTQTQPVVYKAMPGAKVFIDGGKTVPMTACKPVSDAAIKKRLLAEARDKIWVIDLRALGIRDSGKLGPRGFRRAYIPAPLELFINAKPQQIARWPNTEAVPLGKVIDKGSAPRYQDYSMRPGIFSYDVKRAERWTQAKDLYVSGLFFVGYADDTIPIAKIDMEAGTFITALPHLYGFRQKGFTKWYALNLIEEIDLPGEYCVDREAGRLYFYPPHDMTDASIQVSLMTEPLVALENCSHVHFENITFENSRGTGIYIEKGNNNLIAGCTLRNLGILAVQIGKGISSFPYGKHDACGFQASGEPGEPISRAMGSWHEYIYRFTAWDRQAGTNHGILSCDIYDIGAGGISLGGGDRKTLIPAGNYVRNCDISRVNRWDRTYKAPVNIDGVGNRIEYNHIHDCPGMGIYLHGNDHVIQYNEIDHVLTDMSDQGAIYMGRDPSEAGNRFQYNFFHHVENFHEGGHGVQAIFFDDYSAACATVFGNVFYKTGNTGVIKFYLGGQNPIVNNIVIDCPQLLQRNSCKPDGPYKFMQEGLGHERCFKTLDVTKPPYSVRYPVLRDVALGIKPVDHPLIKNYIVKDDLSQFVDPDKMNFALKPDTTVYQDIPGFAEIPFGRIGLYQDACRTFDSKEKE